MATVPKREVGEREGEKERDRNWEDNTNTVFLVHITDMATLLLLSVQDLCK